MSTHIVAGCCCACVQLSEYVSRLVCIPLWQDCLFREVPFRLPHEGMNGRRSGHTQKRAGDGCHLKERCGTFFLHGTQMRCATIRRPRLAMQQGTAQPAAAYA